MELGWSSVGVRVGVRVGSDWSWVRVTRSRLARVRFNMSRYGGVTSHMPIYGNPSGLHRFAENRVPTTHAILLICYYHAIQLTNLVMI